TPNQWQLQNTGESPDQWMLSDDEQRLPAHMQLQDDLPGEPALVDTHWQPIDYQAMQAAAQRPRGGGGAALATLLIVALVGVGGYLAWSYLGQPGLSTPERAQEAALDATPPVDAPAAVAPEPSPTPEAAA